MKQAVDRIDLCGGDFVLTVANGQTYLYSVAPVPANQKSISIPISIPGHYRKWGPAQWALLKELASVFRKSYPNIGDELERAMRTVESNVSRISKIVIKTSKQVFGEAASNPDRPVAIIWTENGARLVLTVPLGARYHNEHWEVFNSGNFQRSISHERSKFGAFFRRYHEFPRVGLAVETTINGRGYLTIKC